MFVYKFQGIDLNYYFEIMNTRGEQLELHEIAKAKFLEVLTEQDKNGSIDLGKYSNMDRIYKWILIPVLEYLLQMIGLVSGIILTILIQLFIHSEDEDII